MKKQVMVRAWEIAREGVKKFGGKVREFFKAALTMAWEETKSPKLIKIVAPARVEKEAEYFVNEINRRNQVAVESGKLTVERANEANTIINKFFATEKTWIIKAVMNDGGIKGQYAFILREYK